MNFYHKINMDSDKNPQQVMHYATFMIIWSKMQMKVFIHAAYFWT